MQPSLEDLRALTVIRPMSWAIVHASKPIENRSWKPPAWIIGKTIAIHGGKKWDQDYGWMIGGIEDLDVLPLAATHTGIVGLARVTGYVTESDDPYYVPGQYGWTLEERVAFPEPIPCRGAQGLWRVPRELYGAIASALEGLSAA